MAGSPDKMQHKFMEMLMGNKGGGDQARGKKKKITIKLNDQIKNNAKESDNDKGHQGPIHL